MACRKAQTKKAWRPIFTTAHILYSTCVLIRFNVRVFVYSASIIMRNFVRFTFSFASYNSLVQHSLASWLKSYKTMWHLDRTASVPSWCSSACNVINYTLQYSVDHMHRWTSMHSSSDISAYYEAFLRICALYTLLMSYTKMSIHNYSTDQMQGIRRMHFDRILNAFSTADERVYR